MSHPLRAEEGGSAHWAVRVRGTVQGVGFRPTVWRLAKALDLAGEVLNDGDGVLIRLAASERQVSAFVEALARAVPPLATIDEIDQSELAEVASYSGFEILASAATPPRTPVTADAYTCPACLEEVLSPFERRYRYPFTNCTHCGPRFSIVQAVPYDRARTTMAEFPLCEPCRAEYEAPQDRRFHAQPIACHGCGPKAWLVRTDGRSVSFDQHSMLDDVDAVAGLLAKGEIVAIRGVGGFHLACDAAQPEAVATLRSRKRRDGKPFALMAPDLEVIRAHCVVSDAEAQLLTSPAAPIVLLERRDDCTLPRQIAPGLATIGFMLPTTPLHHLILRRLRRPAVMTSGNLSSEPQVTGNEEAIARLGEIAGYALLHNREIANRIDDSVTRVVLGKARVLRRARGYAPRPIALPPGFERADGIVAHGGELKSTFCLVRQGRAILSPHQGDLEEVATYDDYLRNLDLLSQLFDHRPTHRAVDLHPEYLSTKLARSRSERDDLPLFAIQHHHAHTAACMAENGVALSARPHLGIALDGLGYGDDGTLWGGEFLLANYTGYRRLATFKPVAMIGGAQAAREPWRNSYAHLVAEIGWPRLAMNYAELDLFRFLETKPRATLDQMVAQGVNSPLASSCGRLFDAVAGAVGIHRERIAFEGQAAMQLEAWVDPSIATQPLAEEGSDLLYPFSIPKLGGTGLPYVEPVMMWQALLGDLILGTPTATIAARFHRGLARVLARLAAQLLRDPVANGEAENTVVLSGGCFQNRILFELTVRELEARGMGVLSHHTVPANDGGLALGQAAIAAATLIQQEATRSEESCV